MQKRFLTKLLGLAAATAVTTAVSTARANLTLTLSEPGYNSATVVDTGNVGDVTYFGSYGTFSTNIVVGFSNKLLPSGATQAVLQVQSLNVTNTSVNSSSPATLTVTLLDDGFTQPGVSGQTMFMQSSLGGTLTPAAANDKVTFQSYVLPNSVTSGLQSYTAPGAVSGTNSFKVPDASTSFVRGATFTLENVTNITLNGGGEQSNVSGTTTVSPTAVPEPITGLGALVATAGLVLHRRRISR